MADQNLFFKMLGGLFTLKFFVSRCSAVRPKLFRPKFAHTFYEAIYKFYFFFGGFCFSKNKNVLANAVVFGAQFVREENDLFFVLSCSAKRNEKRNAIIGASFPKKIFVRSKEIMGWN